MLKKGPLYELKRINVKKANHLRLLRNVNIDSKTVALITKSMTEKKTPLTSSGNKTGKRVMA